MNENPITNEPGWESYKKDNCKSIEYNEYITFHNYEFAILHILEHEDFFPYFNEIIQKYFVDNFERLKEKLTSKINLDGNKVHTFIWGKSVEINYSSLLMKYQDLYNKIKDKDFSNLKDDNSKSVDI